MASIVLFYNVLQRIIIGWAIVLVAIIRILSATDHCKYVVNNFAVEALMHCGWCVQPPGVKEVQWVVLDRQEFYVSSHTTADW